MVLPVNVEGIPEELKALKNWVLWKLKNKFDQKTKKAVIDPETGKIKKTKIPYQATGKPAEANDPDTWSTYKEIIEAFEKGKGKYTGVGFVFSDDTGFTGIDFDHVRNPETGEWNKGAWEEIQALNSYTELSQSETGAHVIVKAKMVKAGRRKRQLDGTDREMYQHVHYFAVTGLRVDGLPGTVDEAQDVVDQLYEKWFSDEEKEDKKIPSTHEKVNLRSPDLTDEEVLHRCRVATNNEKFIKLYDKGDCSEYFGDESRADLALCGLFAFFTQKSTQIDRLFSGSALYRDKWDRADYRDRTINEVLSNIKAVYNPENKGLGNSLYPYILTPKGVGKYQDIKDPEDPTKTKTILEHFLFTPVKITSLSDDLDGEKILYKIGIDHPINGHIDIWKDQGELLTRSGVNKLLSEGLLGTDSSYKDITKYFMKDILRAAVDAQKEFIANKTGWKRDNTIFVAGNEAYTASGVTPVNLTDKDVSKSFSKSGKQEGWANGCRWILQYDSTRINCYVASSSLVAYLLKQPSPILQNKGNTTSGKTLKSSVGVSMFGDPTELVKSADTTRTAAERDAIATNGMCSVLDEVGMLKNPDGLTYLLSNGRKKQRGTKEGREESEYWFKSFILNGEFEFLKESAAQGEIGRLIECSWSLPKDAINAKRTEIEIKEHYGHIAPLFLSALFSRIDSIKERYTTLCSSLPSSDLDIGSRLKDSFALIIIAGEILEDVFEKIGIERKNAYDICEKLYIENINSERVKPYWIRGLNIIFDEINVCKQETIAEGEPTDKFLYKGQIGGLREFEGIYIDILPATFKDMCAKHELKHTQLEQEWRDNSITEVDKSDNKGKRKSQKTTKIDGESKKVIRLIKKEVYKTLDIEVPDETINKALLKHEIGTHLKYYNTIPDEKKESFPQSFFREYPIHRKKCTADNIMNILLEIQAELRVT